MATVAIHPPKTPVHKGIHSIAKNTIPNICKMPGPPAPFVPAPLPNIAKSELSPQGYSTTVEIEGNTVAIRGATYESIGDMASKGTGGGLISANCHGPAKFINPGSMTVMIEGKNVQQLGDMMLNNCGPGGSPPNTGATMSGEEQADQEKDEKCTHPKTHREPPEEPKRPPEEHVQDTENKLNASKARAATLREQLAAAGPTEAPAIATELQGVEANVKGEEFELKVAQEEHAKGRLKETNVKIVCDVCGKLVTEFDIITTDDEGKPVAKECKAGGKFKRDQSITQTAELAKHVPGASLHLTAPKAAMPKQSPSKSWPVKPAMQAH